MSRHPSADLPIEELLGHGSALEAIARRLARDGAAADDLVQTVWLRAIESPPTRAETARGWLGAVLRNVARDGFRADARRAARERIAARPEATPDAADLAARAETRRRVLAALLALDEPGRSLVLLRFFDGLPPREIARRLGERPEIVRSRLHRALSELRDRLGGRDACALLVIPALRPGLLPRLLLRGAIVTGKKQTAAAALLLLAFGLGVGAWCARAPETQPPAVPDVADARPLSRRPPVARAQPTAPTEPAPAIRPAPATPAAAEASIGASVPVGFRRLELRVISAKSPDQPPPGVRELKPGESIAPEGAAIVRGGRSSLGGAGWTRWAPVPAKGTATIRGRVTDASGVGVAGATVYRVELDERGARESPASYQWATEIATTAADGAFAATAQPAGAFVVAADWHRVMNRPRGLDLAASQRAEFVERDTVSGVELRLPIPIALLAGVKGRVIDEDGAPVRNAAVWGGTLRREYTDADGGFALRGIAEESLDLHVEATSFAAWDRKLALVAGRTDEVEVRLALASKGSLHLAGRVVDADGAPVASVPLFLSLGVGRDARWATSGSDGTFRFEKLPDALRVKDVEVQVSPHPERDHILGKKGPAVRAPMDGIEIVVERTATLRVVLKDAATGAPLQLVRMDVEIEVAGPAGKRLRMNSMSVYDEDGTIDVHVPKGRVFLTVEAKDHRGLVLATDVPDVAQPSEVVVELEPE